MAKLRYARPMRINVGEAKTALSKLLARVEAGEDIEIARDGVPVARLVPVESSPGPGAQFLQARGSLAGQISIAGDFELTEAELDEWLDDGV
jgi:prevent-host-death family protein